MKYANPGHEPPPTLETDRLVVRPFTHKDARFILTLLNDKDFIKNIQDRGVRTLDDARDYISNGPIAGYETHGIGLCCVVEKSSQASVGMCGLLQRATLPAPDIGYAFLPEARGKGYAYEAGKAITDYAKVELRLKRILAVTSHSNESSKRLLTKLGFEFLHLAQFEPDSEEIPCYELKFDTKVDRFA
ncbi:MAG: GNAT family N-acetyltransferase [Gammaproteobacteria bacterium]